MLGSGLFFAFLLFPLLGGKEVAETVEVFLHDDAEALGVERRLGEVTVVGHVVHLHREVTIRQEQVLDVEVADE